MLNKKNAAYFLLADETWRNVGKQGNELTRSEAFVFDLSDYIAHVLESQQVRLIPLICHLSNYYYYNIELRSVRLFTWTCVDCVLFMHSCHRHRYGWLSCKPAGCDWCRVQLCLLRPFLSFVPREEKRVAKAEGKYIIVRVLLRYSCSSSCATNLKAVCHFRKYPFSSQINIWSECWKHLHTGDFSMLL